MPTSEVVEVVVYDAPTVASSSCGCGCSHHDMTITRGRTPWRRPTWSFKPGPWP